MKRVLNTRTFGLILLISLFSLNMAAQGPGPGGPGRGFQMTEDDIKENSANTAKTLGLNDEQQKKVLAIDMDFYNKMQIERQKMMNAGGPPADADREAMRAKFTKMRDDRNAQYEAVLSPDQYKQYLQLQEQRGEEMRRQREQNAPPGTGDTPEQPARGRGRN